MRAWPQPSRVDVDDRDSATQDAKELRDRLAASPPGVWERPARSLPNRLATSAVPWLAPRPLIEKAAIGDAGNRHADVAQVVAPDLDRLERHHDDAQVVLEIARTQARDARPDAGSTQATLQRHRQAGAALAAVESRAASARTALAAGASTAALQPVMASVLALEQRAEDDEFRRACLADAKETLYTRQSAAMARLRGENGEIDASVQAELAALAPGVAAVLDATRMLSRQPDLASQARQARDEFSRLESRSLTIQARIPAGFGEDAASARLGARLRDVVRARPANASADALPAVAVMEIASRSMARVTNGDPARAERLLQAFLGSVRTLRGAYGGAGFVSSSRRFAGHPGLGRPSIPGDASRADRCCGAGGIRGRAARIRGRHPPVQLSARCVITHPTDNFR